MDKADLQKMVEALVVEVTSEPNRLPVANLIYDDEPLDDLLYNQASSCPSEVSIFDQAKKILRYMPDGKLDVSQDALECYVAFLETGQALSRKMFVLLEAGAASFLPQWPKPMPPETSVAVGPLLEHLWMRASDWGDMALITAVGSSLWQWYEYNNRYGDARTILGKLESYVANTGNRGSLPNIINNYAFQLQKEKNWKEAAVHYERAATLAAELEMTSDYANSRANYWTSRYEMEGQSIADLIVPELHRLGAILHEAGWLAGERKTLVWLARILADGGNAKDGVPLLKKAILIDEKQNSMYLEHDRILLKAMGG
jgi:hypothetical protein